MEKGLDKEALYTYRVSGQSLVEMSFILPLLLILLFAIIDLGYYVYGYATVYNAARNASNMAAYYPPYTSKMPANGAYDIDNDMCVASVVKAAQKGATLVDLADIASNRNKFTITYLDPSNDWQVLTGDNARKIGNSVQVAITYTIEPLTPLFSLVPVFGNKGKMTVKAASVRTILGDGTSMPLEGYGKVICSK